MLVIVTEEQVLSPQLVCRDCVLADHSGGPRWHQNKLDCGDRLQSPPEDPSPQYRCQMGFRVTNIEE
ncbi:MAG: hypothetical protein ACFCU8_12425 [Thermosynechococcaceae cyanobacterium]